MNKQPTTCSAGLGPTTGGGRSLKSFRLSVMDLRSSTKPNSCLWRRTTSSMSSTPQLWRMQTLTTSQWFYWWASTQPARRASYGEGGVNTSRFMHKEGLTVADTPRLSAKITKQVRKNQGTFIRLFNVIARSTLANS